MDEDRKQKIATEMEMARRELERRSQDTIRIYNPLDHNFRYMRNRYWYSVPSKSFKDVQRYLADHYFKKVSEYMINQQIEAIGNDLKAVREKQMGHVYRDHYEENIEIWDKVPKQNDPELLKKIKEVVIIGLVEEYGLAEPEPDTRIPEETIDFRTAQDKILGEPDKRVSKEMPQVEEIEEIMKDSTKTNTKPSKEKLAEEITNEN